MTVLDHLVTYFDGDTTSYRRAVAEVQQLTVQTAQHVERATAQIQQLTGQIRSWARDAAGEIRNVFTQVAGAVGAIGFAKQSIQLAASAEEMEAAFSRLLRSSEKGKQFVKDLQQLAAQTPLTLNDVMPAARQLLQSGKFTEKDIIPTLRMLGDVTDGNADRFGRMTLAFTQATTMGRLMGQEVMQMTNAGFNPLQYIAKSLGKTTDQLWRDMQAGASVTIPQMVQGFKAATAAGGDFHNAMEIASKLTGGLFSTLKDDFQAFQRSVGNLLVEALDLKNVMKALSQAAQFLAETFSHLHPAVKAVLVVFIQVTAVLGTAIAAWSLFGTTIKSVLGFVPGLVGLMFTMLASVVSTLVGAVTTAVGAVWGAVTTIGGAVLSAVVSVVTALGTIVAAFVTTGVAIVSTVAATITAVNTAIMVGTGPLGVALVALNGIIGIVTSALGGLGTALLAVASALAAVAAPVLALLSPFGLLAAAVTGVAGLFAAKTGLIQRAWDRVRLKPVEVPPVKAPEEAKTAADRLRQIPGVGALDRLMRQRALAAGGLNRPLPGGDQELAAERQRMLAGRGVPVFEATPAGQKQLLNDARAAWARQAEAMRMAHAEGAAVRKEFEALRGRPADGALALADGADAAARAVKNLRGEARMVEGARLFRALDRMAAGPKVREEMGPAVPDFLRRQAALERLKNAPPLPVEMGPSRRELVRGAMEQAEKAAAVANAQRKALAKAGVPPAGGPGRLGMPRDLEAERARMTARAAAVAPPEAGPELLPVMPVEQTGRLVQLIEKVRAALLPVLGFFRNFNENVDIAVKWFQKRWPFILVYAQETYDRLVAASLRAWEQVKAAAAFAWEAVKQAATAAVAWLIEKTVSLVPETVYVWRALMAASDLTWAQIVAGAGKAIGAVIGFFANLGENAQRLFQWLQQNWGRILDGFNRTFNGLMRTLPANLQALFQLIGHLVLAGAKLVGPYFFYLGHTMIREVIRGFKENMPAWAKLLLGAQYGPLFTLDAGKDPVAPDMGAQLKRFQEDIARNVPKDLRGFQNPFSKVGDAFGNLTPLPAMKTDSLLKDFFTDPKSGFNKLFTDPIGCFQEQGWAKLPEWVGDLMKRFNISMTDEQKKKEDEEKQKQEQQLREQQMQQERAAALARAGAEKLDAVRVGSAEHARRLSAYIAGLTPKAGGGAGMGTPTPPTLGTPAGGQPKEGEGQVKVVGALEHIGKAVWGILGLEEKKADQPGVKFISGRLGTG